VRGALEGDQVFSCGTWTACAPGVSPTGGGNLVLFYTRIAPGSALTAHHIPIRIGLFGGSEEDMGFLAGRYDEIRPWVRNPSLRWHVTGGRCHVLSISAQHMGVGSIWLRPSFQSFDLLLAQFWPQPHEPVPDEQGVQSLLGEFWDSRVIFASFYAMLPESMRRPLPGDLDLRRPSWHPLRPCDFLAVSDLVIEGYVLLPGGRLKPIYYTKETTDPGTTVTEGATLSVTWNEPFYVVARGDGRYVVTESGRVFGIPAQAKEGAPLTPLWTGDPVQALITDSSSGKSYAFTAHTFFEIGDSIKPRPHKLGLLRGRTGEEVIATVARCSREIRTLTGPQPLHEAPPPRKVAPRR
jgi:hypothetical protein